MSTSGPSTAPSTHPAVPTNTASSPFNKASADIILRTSDLVDFRVRSGILIESSSVFENILSLPHSPSASDGTADRPVIEISETSNTLDPLLRMCYPVEADCSSSSLALLESMVKAALKYEMEYPLAVLTKELLARIKASQKAPFLIWALAARCRLENMAVAAARNLRTPNWAKESLKGISAGDYYRCREFIRLNGEVPADFRLLSPPPISDQSSQPKPDDTLTPSEILPIMPFHDLVCTSSDGLEFPVHRGIVSAASPILYEKIRSLLAGDAEETTGHRLATKDSPASAGVCVLPLQETSRVLAPLLRMCYPATTRIDLRIGDYAEVLAAAERYQMTRICEDIREQWRTSAWDDPLRAFFTAARMRWTEGAAYAASLLSNKPLDGLYTEEMEDTPAFVYHQLVRQHTRIRASSQVKALPDPHYSSWANPTYRTVQLPPETSVTMDAARRYPDHLICDATAIFSMIDQLLPQRQEHNSLKSQWQHVSTLVTEALQDRKEPIVLDFEDAS